MRRTFALLAVTALVLAGCGSEEDAGSDTTTTADAADTTTTEAETSSTQPSETTAPDSTAPDSTEPEGSDPAPDPAELPGEVFDLYPYEDARLAVVGVDRDDVLNLRAGPAPSFAVVHEVGPIETGLVATGHNRMVEDQIWVEVEHGGDSGWVNGRYVLQLGSVDDITSELGRLPSGETMLDLADAVGELRASDEPPSRLVIVDGPTVGDLGEVMVDVIGLGDDAVGGERLHIFATPAPGGEAFTVKSVERVVLCSRGVTDDFLCV